MLNGTTEAFWLVPLKKKKNKVWYPALLVIAFKAFFSLFCGSYPGSPGAKLSCVSQVSLSKILNPKIAPDVQLAPCVAASAISKVPAMSWQLVQGVPFLHPGR